jgi:hypothetical protein
MFQLNDTGVRSTLLIGKKFMMNTLDSRVSSPRHHLNNSINTHSVKNSTDIMLIGIPNFPRLHRRGKNGSFRTRLMMIQVMEMMYELINAPVPKEVIMFNATALPRLMSDNNIANTYENRIARIGTS